MVKITARRQRRKPYTYTEEEDIPFAGIGHNSGVTQTPGIGVDAHGGGVIDPTKNVEDLVRALEIALAEFRKSDIKYVDTQLVAAEKLQNYARTAEARLHAMELHAENRLRDALRSADGALASAETRRIDQLAQTRQEFQNTIRDMLAESVRTTSTLVSTQLVQIQATFDARVTKLEQAQLTQAGRSSVADPATEAAMSRITGTLNTINAELSSIRAAESLVGGRSRGVMDANSRVMTMIMVLATVATPIIAGLAIFAMRGAH